MTLQGYLAYASMQRDTDDPLYLFDSGPAAQHLFGSSLIRNPSHIVDFLDDLRKSAAESGEQHDLLNGLERCYLTVGPAGSGARLHVDPFAASAWSLLLSGRKAWAL